MSAAYYTVVYRIDGSSVARDRWWRECVMPYIGKDGSPICITVTATFDAVARCDELERQEGSFW